MKKPHEKLNDWGGSYLGGHFGAGLGAIRIGQPQGGLAHWRVIWTSRKASMRFKGHRQATLLACRLGYKRHAGPAASCWGWRPTISFPNAIKGSQTFSSALLAGQASFAELVQLFGNRARGASAMLPATWLIYATGGFAFSYDELFLHATEPERRSAGRATPGTVEKPFHGAESRLGRAGAGVRGSRWPPRWSARLEYLYTQFNTRSVAFPAGAQAFWRPISSLQSPPGSD